MIDIGGTKTLIALFSKRGHVLRRKKFRTPHGSKTFVRELEANLADFKNRKIKSVVVAVPGVVQKNCSVILGNRNWGEFDILTPLKSLFECPIYIDNDGSIASFYEGFGLPGKTVFLTFSTGIGGGVIENNRLLPESSEFEPGHVIYEYAGKKKEWEDIASANAIESHYHIEQATDLKSKEALVEIADRIALGLPDIIEVYHPDRIILGGPLGKIFKLYAPYLPNDLDTKFVRPKRPTESVIYGGYLYAKQKERE